MEVCSCQDYTGVGKRWKVRASDSQAGTDFFFPDVGFDLELGNCIPANGYHDADIFLISFRHLPKLIYLI